MRTIILIAASLLLCGCGDKALDACEGAIKATLKSPSSYKRISAEDRGAANLGSYAIEYDALNPMGVSIRGRGKCYIDRNAMAPHWSETPEQ
jgi:hypothetical protein